MITITREDLYQLVWSVSGKIAAAELGISDSYLARVCRALDVPRPPPGWWAKRRAGVAPRPPALPLLRPNWPESWRKGKEGPLVNAYCRLAAARSAVEEYHPLVARAKEIFSNARPSLDGTHLVTRSHDAIDLTVCSATLEVALQTASALFLKLEKRGHHIQLDPRRGHIRPDISNLLEPAAHTRGSHHAAWHPTVPTVVVINGVSVGLAVVELVEELEMRYVGGGEYVRASLPPPDAGINWIEWRRVPTGRLKIVAYSPSPAFPWVRQWREVRRRTFGAGSGMLAHQLEKAAAELEEDRRLRHEAPTLRLT